MCSENLPVASPSNPYQRMLQVAKMHQAIVSQFVCIVYHTFILLRVRNTSKQTNKSGKSRKEHACVPGERLHQPEQRRRQRGLARARAADDPDLR